LTFYPIYYPFRKRTYNKNLRLILTADINVLVFDWECGVPLHDCSTKCKLKETFYKTIIINREVMFKLVLKNILNVILLSIISFLANAFSSTYGECEEKCTRRIKYVMKTTTYLEGPFTCQINSDIYNIPHTESEEIIIIENIIF
jgi:hypothetical protein